MKIYLDVSCLNRPFYDQSQKRVRLESEAVSIILEECELSNRVQVSSKMAAIEIDAMPDADRKARVRLLLPEADAVLELNEAIFTRGKTLEGMGFKSADAVHLAAAEALSAQVLLSCDDRLCRLGKRRRTELKVAVANPLDWLKEIGHETDS